MSGTHLLRSYAHLDSPIHRLRAGAKLLVTVLFVVGVVLVPVARPLWICAAIGLLVAVVLVARLPPSAFLARLALAQPFVLGVAVLALFQGRGLAVFAALALKSTACVAAAQLFAHTTPFYDLLAVLRRARLPAALILTLALLHRYLFVVIDESRRMRRARAARTWQTSGWSTWKSLASVVAVSFVRSTARAERIAIAMRARGWS
jgi:cobalt/nickel transport system permease protein